MIAVKIVSINVCSLRLMDCIECQVSYSLIDFINRLRLMDCIECQVSNSLINLINRLRLMDSVECLVSYSLIDLINTKDFHLVHWTQAKFIINYILSSHVHVEKNFHPCFLKDVNQDRIVFL